MEVPVAWRVAVAFDELALAIWLGPSLADQHAPPWHNLTAPAQAWAAAISPAEVLAQMTARSRSTRARLWTLKRVAGS